MSSAPLDPEQIPATVKDGVVASIIGGLSMAARLLLSTEPVSFGWVIRRCFAASIVGALVGFGIQDHVSSIGLKMGCVAVSGYAAPEALDYLLRWVKARGEREIEKVQGIKRSNGRRRKKK